MPDPTGNVRPKWLAFNTETKWIEMNEGMVRVAADHWVLPKPDKIENKKWADADLRRKVLCPRCR